MKQRVLNIYAALLIAGSVFSSTITFAADFDTGETKYETGDYRGALMEFLPLAEQGDARAQFNLGVMYKYGQGVPQNYAEAVKWYKQAAQQGDASAQFNLGVMYEYGQGVPQNYEKAHMWLNIARSGKDIEISKNSTQILQNLEQRMTRTHIADAQKAANDCVISNLKNCD